MPLALDVQSDDWGVGEVAAIVCININMIHIASWEAAVAFMCGAGERLAAEHVLYLSRPYRRNGAHTAPSNEAFDAQLRECDPRWSVRDLQAVQALADEVEFELTETVEMSANNLSVIFTKR